MSDKGTDSFVGVIAVLVVVVGIVTGAGGAAPTKPTNAPSSSSTAKSKISAAGARSAGSSTNIPGGSLIMCSGTVIEEKTRTNSSGSLTVRVYYSANNGGRNCAVATTGGSSFTGPRGVIKINLHFTAYQGKSWPKYARHTSAAYASRSGSVYLTNADNRCVVSTATFTPAGGGKKLTVSSGRTGCR